MSEQIEELKVWLKKNDIHNVTIILQDPTNAASILDLFKGESIRTSYPSEGVRIGIIDNDAKGQNGGTYYWTTVNIHFKLTDSEADFIKKVKEVYQIVQSTLVRE